MIELKNVHYGVAEKPDILKDISLTFDDGDTIVITGPNGSGKTSLAKVIAGVAKATSGKIFLDDIDITEKDITERAKMGIAYAFQQPVRFKGLTTRDLVSLATGHEMTDEDMCDVLSSVGLCANDYIDREVNEKLSGGEIKRIEIASVITRDARAYVFDEPEAGIDLWSFNNLIEVFNKLKKKNKGTIIIISHQERILDIADKIAVVDDGRLAQFGPREEIMPNLSIRPHSFKCMVPKEERV